MIERAKQSQWYISEEDLQRYSKIFAHFDKEKRGAIPAEQMRGVFEQTKLEQNVCDSVWHLVNPRNLSQFDHR